MSRNSPNGSTRAWRRLRARKLRAYLLCEEPGCYAPSVEVDHIVPLREWPAGRFVWSNLRALCWRCHKLRHGAHGTGVDGMPLNKDHWWNAD